MLPSNGSNLLKFAKQTRTLAFTLVSQSTKRLNPKQKSFQLVELKKGVKKKPKKRQVVVKRASDDIEAIWLENLNCDNLKLFRKTSFGSFRKINTENLLNKLKELYPAKLGSVALETTSNEKNEAKSIPSSTEKETETDDVKALPYLSEYIIKHITEFPLLKSESNLFPELLKDEIQDYGDVDSQMFPSVTGILNETMSSAAKLRLKKWKEKMIESLGVEGFNKYKEDLLTDGSKFHSTLKTYMEVLDKNLVKVDSRIEGCWRSLERVLPQISNVQFVEEAIYHPVLMYKGIVDCVAAYRGTPCVIEWKKSQKPKVDLRDTHDAPIQLCAYLGALPWHKKVTVEKGLVIVAYTDGSPANIFEMSLESCELYWLEWLRRVQSYWLKKSSILVENI